MEYASTNVVESYPKAKGENGRPTFEILVVVYGEDATDDGSEALTLLERQWVPSGGHFKG